MNLVTKVEPKKRAVQLTHQNGKIEVVNLTDAQIANLVKVANHPKIYILGLG